MLKIGFLLCTRDGENQFIKSSTNLKKQFIKNKDKIFLIPVITVIIRAAAGTDVLEVSQYAKV